MISSTILVGSFLFWAISVAFVIALIVAVDRESGVGATLALAAYLLVINLFGDANTYQYVTENPLISLGLVVGYFAFGALWGTGKWTMFVKDRATEAQEMLLDVKRDFIKENALTTPLTVALPEKEKAAFKEYLKRTYKEDGKGDWLEAPLAKENKKTIIFWMSFWPVSLTWTLINDFVKRLFTMIYNYMSTTLQNISNRAFSNVHELKDI